MELHRAHTSALASFILPQHFSYYCMLLNAHIHHALLHRLAQGLRARHIAATLWSADGTCALRLKFRLAKIHRTTAYASECCVCCYAAAG